MIKNVSHIGIAVRDIDASAWLFEKLLGVAPEGREEVGSQKVVTVFFSVGGVRIELTQGTSADSPVTKFTERRGEGMHHIAFEVDDIAAEVRRLKSDGFILVEGAVGGGAEGSKVAFIHPKSAHGVLIEVTQTKKL